MTFVLELQALGHDTDDTTRTLTSITSIALCGSSVSAFWC
ncbi:MAG: class III lanthipeptide [Propionibacteriaceae bacterium]